MANSITLNKVAAALVGVAMMAGLAFAFAAERAHALSLSELVELFIALEVIPEDKADEARAVLAGEDEEAAPSSCNFTRNLTTGDTGADVMDLQKFLNGKGYTVAASGAGSAGAETEYYGPATAGAVAKFQEAFASEILAPLGLTAGTGFFGASTRAKANSLCSGPALPPPPGDDEDLDDDEDSTDLSGEASLDEFTIDSADDDTLDEGAEDVVVAEGTFIFQDGDARITRMDVTFDAPGSTKLWDVLDTVSLWVDGDKVDEQDASDKDSYYDDAAGTLRFSGLDIVGMEDEELGVEVRVTIQGNVDAADAVSGYTAQIDSIRFLDADNVSTTENSGNDFGSTVSFEVQVAGTDDELIVKSNTSDPDSSTIQVETDAKSDWVTIFVFDLDTDDSVNDVELSTVPVTMTTSHAYNTIVDDARLVIDGTTVDSTSADIDPAAGATTTAAIMDFDVDGDVVIDAGDRVTAELQVRFKALVSEGRTIQGSVSAANANNIVAEGADDLDNTSPDQLTGSATGETHTLRSQGLVAEIVSVDETKTAGDSNSNDIGDYEITFDLSAFEDTFYVSATTSAVFSYHVEDGNGATVATGTTSAVSSSATIESSTGYRIDEGDSEQFTLTVTLNPDVDGYYRVELDSVTYGTSAASPYGSSHTAAPDEDFETGNLYLNA